MTQAETQAGAQRRYQRPKLQQTGPDRRARGFYKAPDGAGGNFSALPLDSAEDATVAAVRLGYKVAAAQIERSSRLADRLHEAGRRQVGEDPERQALDAAEQLLFDTMMTGLKWLEAASEPDSPLRRLLMAQFRLLASFFTLTQPTEQAPKQAAKGADDAASAKAPAPGKAAPAARIFLPRETPRAVRLTSWEVLGDIDEPRLPVRFYAVNDRSASPIEGELLCDQTPPHLHVQTQQDSAPGLWRAAVCLSTGEQMGIIEIDL